MNMTITQAANITRLRPDDALSNICRVLFNKHTGTNGPISNERLREMLCQDADGDRALKQVFTDYRLTPRQRGLLRLADYTLHEYLSQPCFHPALSEALAWRRAGLLAASLDRDSWLERADHPAQTLLRIIGRLSLGWAPAVNGAEALRSRLCGWLESICQTGDVATAARKAERWYDHYRGKVDEQIKRVQARYAATGDSEGEDARTRAATLINRQLAGASLPTFMNEDLHEYWWPALRATLENGGTDSPLWSRSFRTLSLVLWALRQHLDPDDATGYRKLNRVAEQLDHELPRLLPSLVPNERQAERMISHIQVSLHSILRHRQVPRQEVTPLACGVSTSREASLRALGRLGMEDWLESDTDMRVRRLPLGGRDEFLLVDHLSRPIERLTAKQLRDNLQRLGLRPVPAIASPAALTLERLHIMAGDLVHRPGADYSKQVLAVFQQHLARLEAALAFDEGRDGHALEREFPRLQRTARLLMSRLAPGARLRPHDSEDTLTLLCLLDGGAVFLLVDDAQGQTRELGYDALMHGVISGEVEIERPERQAIQAVVEGNPEC
jgi:hypothetical protein